ncbi:Stf0 family sulfotransferase [Sphingomonas sp.]|uniref:Stf0 family sulfotransferase n=1 Tax=Sphingomonas sp. TaxID=28214 RepID=UPI0038AB020A
MLIDIETGYEGRFDFTARQQGPERTYLLASVPRAGSTFFSHLLWRTGCFGAPLEYLNFEPAGPYGFAGGSPDLQRRLWRSVLRRRCSPNGVFGLKAFPQQLEQLQRTNPLLLEEVLATILPHGGPPRIIYLRRRDRLAQTVSYARASMSGVWRKEQERAAEPRLDYSDDALEAADRGIAFQEAGWEQMFSDLRIEPLTVWHEEVLSDGSAVVEAVANYLGVPVDPRAAVEVPQIAKQSEGNSREWAERYARSRGR